MKSYGGITKRYKRERKGVGGKGEGVGEGVGTIGLD